MSNQSRFYVCVRIASSWIKKYETYFKEKSLNWKKTWKKKKQIKIRRENNKKRRRNSSFYTWLNDWIVFGYYIFFCWTNFCLCAFFVCHFDTSIYYTKTRWRRKKLKFIKTWKKKLNENLLKFVMKKFCHPTHFRVKFFRKLRSKIIKKYQLHQNQFQFKQIKIFLIILSISCIINCL